MASNYLQAGNVYDHVAAANIVNGTVVNMNGTLGVALQDIATGETGSVQVTGVFELPKEATAVITQGSPLLWQAATGEFNAANVATATGDVSGAVSAFEDAGNGDTTVLVKFIGATGDVAA